ncbi:hypothetical protein UlMin_014756 [Ulmus minor]
MEEKNDMDKIDDIMLPGFRFHPTDEELVEFYLKSKVEQRSLPIELIKQVDIYKYDPWDLPRLASTGEKEWYFYCPRDRKYRNSARPNRVTGAGFWKATGTDRPIYSSSGNKCIGLKKSLVFYRGRAAKGMKTDWMMHEFRLPSMVDSSPPKKLLDKSFSAHDSWAICRIFKKANSMAQRALSHSWVSPLPEITASDIVLNQGTNCTQFSPENLSCTTELGSAIQFCCNNETNYSASEMPSFKPNTSPFYKPVFPFSNGENPTFFSPLEISGHAKPTVDTSASMFLNPPMIGNVSNTNETVEFDGFSASLAQDFQGNLEGEDDLSCFKKNPETVQGTNQWGGMRSIGFPFSLPSNDGWKPTLPWDSPPCPSEMSTNTYSTNKYNN